MVHRARLRKNYFKLLEKEGVPENPKDLNHEDGVQENTEISQQLSEENDSQLEDEASDEENETSGSTAKRGAPLPSQSTEKQMAKEQERRKPMNFAERAKLARERKEQQRQEQLDRVREKRSMIEESRRVREKKKDKLTQRTRRGQPVMGPRINDLLDKIRKNN